MPNHALHLFCASFYVALVLSVIPTGGTRAIPISNAPPSSASEVVAAVNSLRVSNGLPPYNTHPILMQIAQAQADYMAATNGAYGHAGPDGSRPFQRALAAGYPVAGDLSQGGFFSENWHAGYNLSPSGAVTAWQGDAPHLNTMLSPNLFDVGAGVSQNGSVVYYVLDAGASGSSTGNPGLSGTLTAPGTPLVSQFMVPVTVNTPGADGLIYHEVQYGQTLWSIAIAYETKIDEIKNLNGLLSNDLLPGQKLLVGTGPTPLPATATASVTMTVTYTAVFSETAPASPTAADSTPTETSPGPGIGGKRGAADVAVIIISGALLFAALGTWLGTRKPV